MRSRLRRQFERARAVQQFHARYPHLADAGRDAEARLAETIVEEEALTEQGERAAREGDRLAAEREAQATALVQGLELLIRFMQAVAAGEGIGELAVRSIRFRRAALGAFLREGREALAIAAGYVPRLITYGMPPAMVEVLTRQLEEAEEIQRRRLHCASEAAKAALDLAALAARQAVLLRQMDALNRFRFLAAPERLAEWRTALALPRDGEAALPPAAGAGTTSSS